LDGDLDGLFLAAVVEKGLLRAVVAHVVAGELSGLCEGGEKNDGRNVRTGFGRWEVFGVVAEEGCIVTLAEEIGFPNGFLGQRRLIGN
jgi:hypothetical protein